PLPGGCGLLGIAPLPGLMPGGVGEGESACGGSGGIVVPTGGGWVCPGPVRGGGWGAGGVTGLTGSGPDLGANGGGGWLLPPELMPELVGGCCGGGESTGSSGPCATCGGGIGLGMTGADGWRGE